MGMGGWGALAGLGQGLQQMGGIVGQLPQIKQQAQQQALQMVLQQEASRRAQQQLDEQIFERDRIHQQWMVGNTAGGTVLSPEDMQARQGAGFGAFVKPEMGPKADAPLQVQPGLPQELGGTSRPAFFPSDMEETGRGISIPTEDAKARTAQSNQQASMARMQHAYMMRQAIANEKNRIDLQIAQARDATQRQALKVARGRLDLQERALDQEMTKFNAGEDWKYNVLMPDMANDNTVNAYRAEFGGGGGGQSSGGARAFNTFTGGQLGQAPPGAGTAPAVPGEAPAPAAKRPPMPARPPLGPKVGAMRDNGEGDIVKWDGTAWVYHGPAPSAKKSSTPSKKQDR